MVEKEEEAAVYLDFADSAVVVVVPPVSVESAGSLLLLALVLQAAVEVVSLVMLSLLDAACCVAEVGCLCLVAVGSVMHSQLLSVVVVELVA